MWEVDVTKIEYGGPIHSETCGITEYKGGHHEKIQPNDKCKTLRKYVK